MKDCKICKWDVLSDSRERMPICSQGHFNHPVNWSDEEEKAMNKAFLDDSSWRIE